MDSNTLTSPASGESPPAVAAVDCFLAGSMGKGVSTSQHEARGAQQLPAGD